MKITKINIKNFKSIEDLELDFTILKGMWEISGAVGSGKTTLGEAILFGLFGTVKDKNNTNLIRWGQKKALVEVWCTSKHNHIHIRRHIISYGQSPLEVEVDGNPIVFTNKRDAQVQLEKEYYDVSRLIVETLCVISFNGFRSLSSLNTADTRTFLDQAFGFKVITQYADLCKERVQETSKDITALENIISASTRQIESFRSWASKDEHITPDMMEGVKRSIQETRTALEASSKIYNAGNLAFSNKENTLGAELAVIKDRGASLKKNIEFLKKGICPTCGAPLDTSHLAEHEKERNILLENYRSKQADLDSIKRAHAKYTSNTKDQEDLRTKLRDLETLRNHYKEQLEHQKSMTTEIVRIEEDRKKQDAEKRALEATHGEWEELYNILSYDTRVKILSSMVPTINEYIGLYMAKLHQPYVVKFDNDFKCSIQIAGMTDPIPVSSLSTGQLKTVDMVIILSVLKVLLSNVAFNICFLDELLSNLDEDLRDIMCHLLRDNNKEGQTLFIISHAPLSNEYLDGRLKVTNTGSSSYVMESQATM